MNSLSSLGSLFFIGNNVMKNVLVKMNLDICGGSTIVDYNEQYHSTTFGINPLTGTTKTSFLTVTNETHHYMKTSDILSLNKNCSIYIKYKPRINNNNNNIFSQYGVYNPMIKIYNYQAIVTAGTSFQIAVFKLGVGSISYNITGISSQDLNGSTITGNLTNMYTLLYYKSNINTTINFQISSVDVFITSATGGDQNAIINFSLVTLNGSSVFTNYTVIAYTKIGNDYINTNISANGANSPITISGLTNETSYYFTVTASNAMGTVGNKSMITTSEVIPNIIL